MLLVSRTSVGHPEMVRMRMHAHLAHDGSPGWMQRQAPPTRRRSRSIVRCDHGIAELTSMRQVRVEVIGGLVHNDRGGAQTRVRHTCVRVTGARACVSTAPQYVRAEVSWWSVHHERG
jgi:hypothetical protein